MDADQSFKVKCDRSSTTSGHLLVCQSIRRALCDCQCALVLLGARQQASKHLSSVVSTVHVPAFASQPISPSVFLLEPFACTEHPLHYITIMPSVARRMTAISEYARDGEPTARSTGSVYGRQACATITSFDKKAPVDMTRESTVSSNLAN